MFINVCLWFNHLNLNPSYFCFIVCHHPGFSNCTESGLIFQKMNALKQLFVDCNLLISSSLSVAVKEMIDKAIIFHSLHYIYWTLVDSISTH